MASTRKNIDLDNEVIKTLQIQAINAGFSNIKSYIEYLLIEQSKKK